MFTREELQLIREKALETLNANLDFYTDTWRITLQRLANSADYLDAMLARKEK